MKTLLRLILALMFFWGCAVKANEQISEPANENASKQISEVKEKNSQEESSVKADKKKPAATEEEPDCE